MRASAKAPSEQSIDRGGMFRGVASWLLLAALACAALAVYASPAGAATAGISYGYQEDIGTADTTDFGFASTFQAVAVSNDDGRVFIVRGEDFSVDIINPDGTPLARASTNSPPSGVAVSADGSTMFIINVFSIFSPPTIEKYTSDGAPTPTYTLDGSWAPSIELSGVSGIAIDPTTGDLLVGASGGIYRFDAGSGALLSSFDGSSAPRGGFNPRAIAPAPNGDIYAVAGPGRLEHMGADGSWKGELKDGQLTGVWPMGIAVNPQNGDVAVVLPQGAENVLRIYTAANNLKETIHLPEAVASGISGLAFSPDGTKLYMGLKNGSAHVFALGTQPGVDPPLASDITTTGAHLTATVATNGEPTDARIEYCLASDPCDEYLGSEGSSPWHVVSEQTGLSDPQATAEGDINGLAPSTEYLLRVTAINKASQVEARANGSFSTALVPPDVETGEASSVTDTSAQLSGTIGTFGGQTTYHFEYGPTTSYGSDAPAGPEAIAGNERSPRTFTQTLKGLQPGTTYHYRLVATNAAGTSLGEDRTFTTLAADEVAPRRVYEMVTPVEKKGFAIFNNWGFQASADGSAIAYSGSAPSSEASGSAQASRYMSSRGADGWLGQLPLDPPIDPIRSITFATVHAVSDDFEHTFVVSQKALTPDAVEGAANIFVKDVDTGAYHLVGTTTQLTAFSQMVGPTSLNIFIGGAPDFSWVVFISRSPLLPDAPQVAMYKWTRTGGLSLISLLPGDTVPTGNTWFQSSTKTTNRLVSDDGETFAFSLTSGEKGVYRRSDGDTEAVSVSQATGGPPGAQPGIADGMSRDGRYVVFHSRAQLTDSAIDSGMKLYRYDSSSGELEYLGHQDQVSDGSDDVVGIGDDAETVYFNDQSHLMAWHDGALDLVSDAAIRAGNYGYPSPNGRYFLFSPEGGGTHLYDAVSGETICISCRPSGPSDGSVPGADRNFSNRFPQVVTDDGHAFFMSTTPLLASDRNGAKDVYEYFGGRLALVSPGDRDFEVNLADITPDGNTVFFTTAEGIVKQDTDGAYDLYAARVGGGFPDPPPPPTECSGEACRTSASVPPASPSLGSSAAKKSRGSKPTAVRCSKGAHKVRRNGKARCVKNKHKSKKRETKHNRGAGR